MQGTKTKALDCATVKRNPQLTNHNPRSKQVETTKLTQQPKPYTHIDTVYTIYINNVQERERLHRQEQESSQSWWKIGNFGNLPPILSFTKEEKTELEIECAQKVRRIGPRREIERERGSERESAEGSPEDTGGRERKREREEEEKKERSWSLFGEWGFWEFRYTGDVSIGQKGRQIERHVYEDNYLLFKLFFFSVRIII